jgi:hypothetical protein
MRTSPQPASRTSAVLHGAHPLRGYPVTYKITPATKQPGMPAMFLVEEADGLLETDEAWQAAERSLVVMTTGQVRDLVARVKAGRAHATV